MKYVAEVADCLFYLTISRGGGVGWTHVDVRGVGVMADATDLDLAITTVSMFQQD